jgi:hypothetical protein
MKKSWLIIIVMVLFSTQLIAQFSMSVGSSYLNTFGETGLKNFGINGQAGFNLDEKTQIYLSGNYYFPKKIDETLYAFSKVDPMMQKEIPVQYGVSFSHFSLGARRSFVGAFDDVFNFYGVAEGALMFASMKLITDMKAATPRGYTVKEDDLENMFFGNPTIGLGLGFEVQLDLPYLYSEIKLNIPSNSVNGREIEVSIPASFSVFLGLRFPFGYY